MALLFPWKTPVRWYSRRGVHDRHGLFRRYLIQKVKISGEIGLSRAASANIYFQRRIFESSGVRDTVLSCGTRTTRVTSGEHSPRYTPAVMCVANC